MRTLAVLLLLALTLGAQDSLTIFPLNDIAGTGSPVNLASSGAARWCQLVAPAGNASVVRWGDSTITTSRGSIIAAGGGQFVPPMVGTNPPGGSAIFQLANVYVLVQIGDSLSATCGR
jgi:hypothetical protein